MIPFITLNLGGKTYELRFGLGAMVRFEQISGKSLVSLGEDLSITTISQLLWAMLREKDENITPEKMYKLIDDNAENIMEITNIVTKAIQTAFGASPNARPSAAKKK